MPTKRDEVKRSSPDGGKTLYIENQRVANDLKGKGVKAVAGKASGDRSKARAKGRQYVERKRGSTPTKRTVAGGPNQSAQPISRPASPPPAQTFAQNGQQLPYSPMPGGQPQQRPPSPLMPANAPMNPNYQPSPTYPTQMRPPMNPNWQPSPSYPQQRPSAFGQPNSTMTMGIQPMGNPYMNSQNPAQVMQGYQPPMNPWGRRW
jgi:hypothetical protein